ncbi:nucleotide sugar dehydrogenase [Candidatus Pelagibacter sp.]|nr:nucleotide sugar dehydrogenase [Candidatus Pelagibacter sp.]
MKKKIHHLITKIKKKNITIGIVGLGYVGLPLALRFSEVGFNVIGYDKDKQKTLKLKKNKSYIKSISDKELKKKNFTPTSNLKKLSTSDAIIICLPTPLRKNSKVPDMTYIKNFASSIKTFLRENHIIILESTTYPGTTREFFLPVLENCGFRPGEDVFLIYSPEREDPGNKKYKIKNIPKIVSGYSYNCKKIGSLIYGKVAKKTVEVKSLEHAEMVKLYENIYRSINIGLANEMKIVCEKMSLNIFEVIKAASTKPFGFSPFYPGPGYGGHCIPIDPFYLSWKSQQFGYKPKFIELSAKINNSMPSYIKKNIKKILKEDKKKLFKILILGIAYKKNVDDLRESPAVQLINILHEEKNLQIYFYDPFIKKIDSRNKKFKDINYFNLKYNKLNKFDLVAILTDHDILDYKKIFKYSKIILDCRGRFFNVNDKKVIQS